MCLHPPRAASALALAVLLHASAASTGAQPVEVLGVRALGMAGAFVGVANDPSAVYWNPAGLVAADFFGALVEFDGQQQPRDATDAGAVGPRDGPVALVSVATPPLGLSYYRLAQYGADRAAPSEPGAAGSQGTPVARLETQHVGVTLVQSLVDGVTVGATLKYVHGAAGSGVAPSSSPPGDLADRARDLETSSEGTFDLDLGVRVAYRSLAVGFVARNLRRPGFASPEGRELRLDRQLRVGLSVQPRDGWVVAGDVDLDEAASFDGIRRRAALGVERWIGQRRLGLRGGLGFSTKGDADPVAAFGASVAIRAGLWVEGHLSQGGARAPQTWGLGLRFGY